MFQGFFR